MTSLLSTHGEIAPDSMSRVIQGITAGVGFLGAGEIFRQSDVSENKVKISGLTSAAAIWVSSALGVAIGAGLYPLALVSVLMTWITLSIIKQFER
jgi:putative Mg2+ transporter-C (MgtC) family protein